MSLRHMMYAAALRIGLHREEAADAVQKTLLRLWRSRNGLPDDDLELSAYCIKALRNECISCIRRRHPSAPMNDFKISLQSDDSDLVENTDTLRHLERLIDSLPENQRIVLRMKSFGDFDNEEIEKATGLSPENIRQLLSRARKRLRMMMKLNK